jgi:hypothetical protein
VVAESTTSATQAELHALIARSSRGVLVAIKADGRPQLSPVTPYYDVEAGAILVSGHRQLGHRDCFIT